MKTWLKGLGVRYNFCGKATRRVSYALALMLMVSSCGGTITTNGANNDLLLLLPCRAFAPIAWSEKDTDTTLRGVKAHNAVWFSMCRKG
jgi:hypothetical protein